MTGVSTIMMLTKIKKMMMYYKDHFKKEIMCVFYLYLVYDLQKCFLFSRCCVLMCIMTCVHTYDDSVFIFICSYLYMALCIVTEVHNKDDVNDNEDYLQRPCGEKRDVL